MELHTYAGVVEENYQRLADLLLSADTDALKVQRLLSIDLLPTPPIQRGYAIWSEGLLAEAFVCFPTPAFPALLGFQALFASCPAGHDPDHLGSHLRRDNVVSVLYAEELNSTKSSVSLQRTDRHGILGQKSSDFQRFL